MNVSRRSWLQRLGAASAASIAGVGTGFGVAATKPSVEWIPADPSNYTDTSRGPATIDWVVVHTIEGPASAGVNVFQNPSSDASAHYVVGENGHQIQMVADEDRAWHAGNGDYNVASIGIEHAGYADRTNFSNSLYQASAEITAYVADEYNVPLERPAGIPDCNAAGGGVIGHDTWQALVDVPN